MTPRQKEALRWLEGVGEASEFAVHRAGIQTYTQTPDEPARLEVRARALRTDVDWMGP